MQCIRAGLGHNRDYCAGREAVLRLEVISEHAELLGRVGVGERRGEEVIVVHVDGAVEHVQSASLPAAIRRGAFLGRKCRISLVHAAARL